MNREELKEKIIKISNSEFPLIDFFNDIDWLDDRHFNTEKAYEDIEKIYNVFMFYINKCKQLEKELKQTKLNFKNSQTHSKNCYKKLKEKFERGKEVYHRNYELIQENGKLKQENQELEEKVDYYKKEMESEQCFRENLQIDLIEFVGAIKILKDFFIIHQKNSDYLITATGFDKLSQMDYELLKRVFESVGDSDE